MSIDPAPWPGLQSNATLTRRARSNSGPTPKHPPTSLACSHPCSRVTADRARPADGVATGLQGAAARPVCIPRWYLGPGNMPI